jgi:SWI/SNF chromatin-remodeling complex subunit SWI1
LAREVDTYGGRDLRVIGEEITRLTQRRPIRDINDWGNVDIEHLIMSIRSRLSTELSYALTTFTLLSTMRAQTQGSGFPISQCVELLEEVVDLLEDEAFGDEDGYEADLSDDPLVITHREMVNHIQDDANELFVGLKHRQGSKDPAQGPRQREGHIVLAVLNIIRNLSTFPDNWSCLAQQEGMLDLMLRVCSVERSKDGTPRAVSTVLSLTDLITARKDVLYTLTNLAGLIQFTSDPSLSKLSARMVRRMFELISSFLVDPMEAVPPLTVAQQSGIPLHGGNVKAPTLPDIALEVFTRLCQQDSNRQVFSRSVPPAWLRGLFKSLVHRLPVIDPDFQLAARDTWLAYLEKTVLAIYSLAFLLPPGVKAEIKADHSLAFTKVMLRMIQKFLMNPVQEGKSWFMVCTRRAIETLKLVDDAADSFDMTKSTAPTLSFGMGFSEVGDGETETGTGLLGGYRRLAWDMLMVREVDSVMFSELESLARVS